MPLDDYGFDEGASGGSGSKGPWLSWQAKEATDGSVPGRSFVLRDEGGKRKVDFMSKGVVIDYENAKTGWCYGEGVKGVAPKWVWGQSMSRMPEQPGPDYKKGFSLPMAFGQGEDDYVNWEQAQAGAWSGFADLMKRQVLPQAKANAGKLPVIKFVSAEKLESKKGITFAPRFELVKWVEPPPALRAKTAADAGFDDVPV